MSIVDIDAWVTACVLLLAMLGAWEGGLRVGRGNAHYPSGASIRIDEATGALLALLLGFTFATAQSKHDRRLWMMVNEATAIGDLAGAGSVLEDPARTELGTEIHHYLDLRIASVRASTDEATQRSGLERTRNLQDAMTNTIARAIRDKNTPSVHNALVTHMNAVTTAFENRRASAADHVPPTVLVMLLCASVAGAFAIGRIQGVAGAWQPIPTVVFLGLIALLIYVTIDLEQPRSGIVQVPVAALESVRSTLR